MIKIKIINDPIYGLIRIENKLILDLLENPFFQRLRRIQQLSVSQYVYPAASHTRFSHSLGAYHLMTLALEILKNKKIKISEEEKVAAQIAVLLHDIGHSPFSHTLEAQLVKNIKHETITLTLMKILNKELNNRLDLAISIFNNTYERKFFHQLVSGQLDTDRLDYLTRDSFFTGVTEGFIGYDRIVNMLNVYENELVIEEKGIYSVEKFLIARRLMYWQVYFHKTVWAIEKLVTRIFDRIIELKKKNISIDVNNRFVNFFVEGNIDIDNEKHLIMFSLLDDTDIICTIKELCYSDDKILSFLCNSFIKRQFYKTKIYDVNNEMPNFSNIKNKMSNSLKITDEEMGYFYVEDTITNIIYDKVNENIKIITKNSTIKELTEFTQLLINKSLNVKDTKYYVGEMLIKTL